MDLAAGVLPEDYLRLRRMARAKLRQYAYHHSIQATDLVHLAWLKMEDHSTPSDKEHFFSYASVVMRNILVDRAASVCDRLRRPRPTRMPWMASRAPMIATILK